jgi:hypothetical protein
MSEAPVIQISTLKTAICDWADDCMSRLLPADIHALIRSKKPSHRLKITRACATAGVTLSENPDQSFTMRLKDKIVSEFKWRVDNEKGLQILVKHSEDMPSKPELEQN